MLGADGPRTYLVLFQNLAEVRATGGVAGAFAVIRADRGRVEIVGQGSASADLRTFEAPVLRLDPAMRHLYSDRLGKFPADVNFTPHFPTAAKLAREMYRRRTGVTVDGVLATDPVALSYLLRATGPVQLPSGDTLTAANAVRRLLSDVYARLPSSPEQDAYFAGAARAAFGALTGGRVDPVAAISGLTRAAEEHRLLLWSAHESEQDLLTGTVLEGALPDHDEDRPTVGVYLNDGTGAKLSYYLELSATLSSGECRPDGRRALRLRIALRSTAPPSGLSPSVLGAGDIVAPYITRTNVMVFSPTRGGVVAIRRDGRPARFGAGLERRRAVAVITIDLRPGQATRLDVDLLSAVASPVAQADLEPAVLTTPGVNPWPITVDSAVSCPAVR
jgi:hypothetical protein